MDRADGPARRGSKATPGFFIFEQDLTFLTRSPSLTAIAGRIPTYSSPNSATRFTAGAEKSAVMACQLWANSALS
jgi:hypothetical protein